MYDVLLPVLEIFLENEPKNLNSELCQSLYSWGSFLYF